MMDHMKDGMGMKEGMKDGMCMNCDHDGGCHCKCPHHKIVPVLVVLFGALFWAGNWGWVSMATVQTWWPVLVTAAGATKLGSRCCKCC